MFKETIFQGLYFIPLVGAIFLAAYTCLLLAPKQKKHKNIKLVYDPLNRPFQKNWANDLYMISFKSPISNFLPDDDLDRKAIKINHNIAQAGLSQILDFRVLTTLQLILFSISVILTVLIGFLLVNSLDVWCALFNLNIEEVSPMMIFLITGCTLLLCSLIPKFYINSKANSKEIEFLKNLPILQIFLISMIKSGRPIQDILYTLGNADTVYKTIFSNAYRIFVRDKVAAYDFLAIAFADTGWANTISILRSSDMYSQSETCKSLINQMRDLEEEVSSVKGSKRNLKSLISEGSIALPFIAIMLLTVVPILMYGFEMINKAMNMVG